MGGRSPWPATWPAGTGLPRNSSARGAAFAVAKEPNRDTRLVGVSSSDGLLRRVTVSVGAVLVCFVEPPRRLRDNCGMKRLPALLLVGLALSGAAAPSHSAGSVSAQRFRITVYFLTDGQSAPLGVRRTVVRRGFTALARFALQQLLAGPSAHERSDGLTSAIPSAAKIRSFSILQQLKGSTATVDLTGLPSLASVNGVTIARVGTQIARTIIGLSDITRVRIESNGRPWNFGLMRGGISMRLWDYQLLVGLWVGNFKALP